MIALMGASESEIGALRKFISNKRRNPDRAWHVLEGKISGKNILLVRTGVGKVCAQAAAEFILRQYPIKTIISLGFSGALVEGLDIGTLALCRKLFHSANSAGSRYCSSDADLIAQANKAMKAASVNLLNGDSLTTDQMVICPEEKVRLAKAFQAQVVDMESYHIAAIAERQNIPFLAVRAISDTISESLPPFTHFINAKGRWLWIKALHHFLVNPRELIKIPPIFSHAQTARRSLTSFIQIFLLPSSQGNRGGSCGLN